MKKRFLAICAMCTSAALAFSGCGIKKETSETGELAPVTLSWYVRPTAQKDMQSVQDEMNKYLKEKINAQVEIKRVDPGAYEQKMRVMLSANEDFDMCYMSPQYGFLDYIGQNSFLPLDELLKEYAPKTLATVPGKFWDATKVDSKIYGVVNYQITARAYGFFFDKALSDKYNFDVDSVTSLESTEPFLQAVKDNEGSEMIPFGIFQNGVWGEMITYYGFNAIDANPGVVRISDDDFKVVNEFDSPEFTQHVKTMQNFYSKGFIPKDAAVNTNGRQLYATGKVALTWNNKKPGDTAEVESLYGNKPLIYKELAAPFVITSNLMSTLSCISRTSKKPERAMMFLELMNTDKELYNMMCFGIEGTHYNKTGENRIELIPDSGYAPNCSWMFGNQFNAYLLPTQPDDVWEQTIELNNSADTSKFLGFVFDPEPVANEVAQCLSVVKEYTPGLITGSVDADKFIPEFNAKLKGAGVDTIVAEKQKQLDAWRAAQ